MGHNIPGRAWSAKGHRRMTWALVLLPMFFCLLWVLPAGAQSGPGAGGVEGELEKTDRILAKARELAGPTVSAAARRHYDPAHSLQR